ncbi:hypothetical protein CJU90_2033 [Yarrowia sp. C11]|nr:hypothetical protein CKK34_6060 [Yarrowia sp. E02]KAG5371963.1 hypothetical protein CJU90_2033 [Yarrowia sp. C11]
MDLLGITLENAVLPTLNATIRNRKPFPAPIAELTNTNVLLSKFYHRPRDASGSSWLICCVDDRRKRILCAISPEVARLFYNKYQTELTEETGLVVRFQHAPHLSLISGSFVDSLPPFLPVQYDPSNYQGISDARMILVVTQPLHKVTQGASLQHRFVPMLSVVLDRQQPEADMPIYPPDRGAKRRVEFQEGYMSQGTAFTDLRRLSEPSRGSLEDGNRINEELMGMEERQYETPKVEKTFDHSRYLEELVGEEMVERIESVDVDQEQLQHWTEVFGLLKENSELPRRTPFLGSELWVPSRGTDDVL